MDLPVYLDYNATTPCDPQVVEAMLPYFTLKFGNAASKQHFYGWQAEEAVDRARGRVAALIGAEEKEIVFTSGATEAINLALKGAFEAYASKGAHVITTNIEHKAVLDTCKALEKKGADVTYLPVNDEGLITVQQVEEAIRPDTILIAVMYANNEIGTVMPVKEIGAVAKKHEVIFFTDATQAIGKIPVDVIEDNIDMLSLSAHKLYGPKGIGALYIRRRSPRVRLTAQIDGGGHERGFRSGTLNVPGIVGLGRASELAADKGSAEAKRLEQLRDKLEAGLLKIEETGVNGRKEARLPNVTNIHFKYAESQAIMMALKKELAVSSGSACTSASIEPSYVLKALGLSDELAHSSLRFTVGRFTTEEEIDFVVNKVTEVVTSLREVSPVWEMYKQGILD